MQYFHPTNESQRYELQYQYNKPPTVAKPFTWEIEMEQRKIDRTRFPDYGQIYGESTNNTGYTQSGGREPLSWFSPFTVPYAGPKSTVATVSGVQKRAYIDTPPVDASDYRVHPVHLKKKQKH